MNEQIAFAVITFSSLAPGGFVPSVTVNVHSHSVVHLSLVFESDYCESLVHLLNVLVPFLHG